VLSQTLFIDSIKMLFRSLLVGLPLTAALPGLSFYLGVDSFLGMPFAKASRLENPRLVNAKQDKLEGVQDATSYGDACPQTEFVGLTSSTEVSLIMD
jgi:hypothetical protein